MTITWKESAELVVPPSIQRRAGIKRGDRLKFQVSRRTITITASEPTYRPSKSEWAAIRRGEAAIARGESVSLSEFLDGVESHGRKAGLKASRKVSR